MSVDRIPDPRDLDLAMSILQGQCLDDTLNSVPGHCACCDATIAVSKLRDRLDLANRIIEALHAWEKRGLKGHPVSLYDLLEIWEKGPKRVQLN